MKIILYLNLMLSIACGVNTDSKEQTANDKTDNSVCIDIGEGSNLVLIQESGEEKIIIAAGDCDGYEEITSFRNVSLSDISIPEKSIFIYDSTGLISKNIVYFKNDNIFFLGLLGIGNTRSLYRVSIKEKTVEDLGIRTSNLVYHIDLQEGLLATSSTLNIIDSLFSISINYYNISDASLSKTFIYNFPHEILESVLDTNLFLISHKP